MSPDNSILLWLLLVPALAGCVAFVWPNRGGGLMHVLMLAVSAWLVYSVAKLQGQTDMGWQWTWMEVGPATVAVDLLVTRFGGIIALLGAIFGLLISIYCVGFTRESVGKHNAFMLWTLAGAMGIALANNLLFLLICWEVTTLMLYLLINLGGEKAKAGAGKTFAILGLSDCAMLLAIVLLLFATANPTLTMSKLNVAVDSPLTVLCYLLMLVAALAKAGAMPLHTWIPAAAAGAPTDVMAFLPAALDKLLGVYLLARVSLEFFVLTPNLKMLLMIIGAITIIGGVMMAMIQHDLKKLLSFHAVSQVGYMVLGIGTGSLIGVAGGLFHMFNNAIYKSCLFLAAGSVEKQTGTTDLDKLGGLAKLMPLSFFACLIAALAISGVPPMNGFASKWLIYQAALDVPSRIAPLLVAAAVFGSALTLASFIKILHSVFLGSPSAEIANKRVSESSGWMTIPMLVLALTCIAFGVFATAPLSRLVAPAMEDMGIAGLADQLAAGEVNALTTLWNPVLATILLVAAFVVGGVIFLWGKGLRVRHSTTYIGGEIFPPERGHYSGTNFYGTVQEMRGVSGALGDAEKESFDIYRIGGQFGGTLVEGLRRCQTGMLPLYVSWVVLGLVLILFYLLEVGGA